MNLYPELTPADIMLHAAVMSETVRQNYRLKASVKNANSWLEMEIYNDAAVQNKAPEITYIATICNDSQWFRAESSNPIEAVDEVLKKAGITKVQQYIDLKTLTESLSKGAAQ